MDKLTPERRKENMAAIRSANTAPELFVRRLLHSNGFRYRLQAKQIPGRPDIWIKKYNTAIYVNGCFWHRHENCKYAYMPKSRVDFWNHKFMQNIARDQKVREELQQQHIRCLVIWECAIKRAEKSETVKRELLAEMISFFRSEEEYKEI